MKVNVTGTFLCVSAVAPAMREAKWGRIVNISSNSVPLGVTNYLHYVTSKAAVIGMTNALARELGPHGITVNAIRPGGVATEVERTVNPSAERRAAMLSAAVHPARTGATRHGGHRHVPVVAGVGIHHGSNDRMRRRHDAQPLTGRALRVSN